MANYRSYTHVERLGKDEVDGILDGVVHVFPKLDGTNACVWYDDDGFHAGSRKREITRDNDNAGFYAYAADSIDMLPIRDFCEMNRDCIVYGEFLGTPDKSKPLGTIKDYVELGFYVIDVFNMSLGRYLTYDEYSSDFLLGAYGRIVPPIVVLNEPSADEVVEYVKDAGYDMPDGDVGEGIVIKNYDFRDIYGNYQMAKVVTSEFHAKKSKPRDRHKTDVNSVMSDFIECYVTAAFMSKCRNKIENAIGEKFDTSNGKHVGMFMNLVVDDVMNEEFWGYFRKRLCTIDLGALRKAIQSRARDFLF